MLTITKHQIDQLYTQRLEQSITSYAAHFRSTLPVTTKYLDDDNLRERLLTGITDARAYEIVKAPELAMYLMLCVVVGPAFCKHPNVDHFMRHPGLDQAAKLKILMEQFSERIQNEGVERGTVPRGRPEQGNERA